MNELALITGALYGVLAVLFGAFGAHALKKTFSLELQNSFETGVKYQMYHAIVLLLLGSSSAFDSELARISVFLFIFGVFLFSFSIYGLCISSAVDKKIRILGPITPLGGLLLVSGWVCLLISFWLPS